MTIQKFREKIKAGINLSVKGENFLVREVIKFRFDDGNFYIKCILNDGYVFADDAEREMFLLVADVKTLFSQPFGDEIEFNGKKFRFLFQAHAVAEETNGEEILKRGYREAFWDFQADDGSYLSLGIDDKTKRRMDFYGKIINPSAVELYGNSF